MSMKVSEGEVGTIERQSNKPRNSNLRARKKVNNSEKDSFVSIFPG